MIMMGKHIAAFARLAPAIGAATFITIASWSPARAGDADVLGVVTRQKSPGVYDFDVTIRSKDTGWERFADRIEAVGMDGTIYGTRLLEHPHDAEQPFTRDLYNVRVPGVVNSVIVRVHFKPTGYDGVSMAVTLGER